MTVRRKFVRIGLPLAAVFLWPFVGFVYNVGDRETDAGWDIFIKSSPSLQFRFSNPARDGLRPDVVPFDQLDDARKEETRRYCKIRYGIDDMAECYRRMIV
jgi:hypothetical protein